MKRRHDPSGICNFHFAIFNFQFLSLALVFFSSCQHHCPDDSHQNQHRGHFKRKQVIAEQCGTDAPGCTDCLLRISGRNRKADRPNRTKHEEHLRNQNAGEWNRQQAQSFLLLDFRLTLRDVQKHYDENEQHHNRAGVDYDLNRRDELRSQSQIEHR